MATPRPVMLYWRSAHGLIVQTTFYFLYTRTIMPFHARTQNRHASTGRRFRYTTLPARAFLLIFLTWLLAGCAPSFSLDLASPPATPMAVPSAATTTPADEEQAARAATPTPDPARLLLGRRVGLDPGHGPRNDLGAVLVDRATGKLVLSEDELNLDVAKRTRDILVARGAAVTLTRESKDEFTAPWPPDTNGDGVEYGQSDDLQQRVDILNASGAEVFLSIHANSASNPAKRQGMQALYCATEDCAFPAETKRLGQLTLDHLQASLQAAGYEAPKRELRSDVWRDTPDEPARHLFLLGPAEQPRHPRATAMPGIVIEALYVTSPEEAAQLNRGEIREAIALAYAGALTEYLVGRK